MRHPNKIRAGALQFATYVALIIAFVLSFLLLYNYNFRFFKNQSATQIKLMQFANSGMEYLLLEKASRIDTVALPFLSDNDKVRVALGQWGIYKLGWAEAQHGNFKAQKIALIGSRLAQQERQALYLKEDFLPLSVSGNTMLEGKLSLPRQRIKFDFLNGEGFTGKITPDGAVAISDTVLPALDRACRAHIAAFLAMPLPKQSDRQATVDLLNSFSNPIARIGSASTINLQSSLRGKIVVTSDQKIVVSKNARLQNIILMAPEIIVEDGFSGSFQAFATKNISIGENCRLQYPTSLLLLEKEKTPSPLELHQIAIAKNTTLKGSVCFLKGHFGARSFANQIKIAKDSRILGEVFCEGNLQLEGSVAGSVYTYNFGLERNGNFILNHLNGGKISAVGFPEAFAGLLFDKRKNTVAKWVN